MSNLLKTKRYSLQGEDSIMSLSDLFNYSDYLSSEMIQSLQSVKHTSLNVLGTLLKQMTEETAQSQSSLDLQKSSSMSRSRSSPTSLKEVERILECHMSDKGYTLCCSIAALLKTIYQLLDKLSSQDTMIQLQEQLDKIQTLKRTETTSSNSQEILVLWKEMDHLTELVCKMIMASPPPAYDDSLPEYEAINTTRLIESNRDELDRLLMAIQELSNVAPRFNNQRAILPSVEFQREKNKERLLERVERLQSRRMNDQRVYLKQDKDVLQQLIQQIQSLASRTFDNQRVQLKSTGCDIQSIVDRMQKCRYVNQDAVSYEEKLIQDLTHTTDLLAKSVYRPAYNRQRSELKIPEQVIDKDLEQLFSFIHKSTKQLNNQRASFTL
ncbi:unnamed protein product [Rhizopus stolonifer]